MPIRAERGTVRRGGHRPDDNNVPGQKYIVRPARIVQSFAQAPMLSAGALRRSRFAMDTGARRASGRPAQPIAAGHRSGGNMTLQLRSLLNDSARGDTALYK